MKLIEILKEEKNLESLISDSKGQQPAGVMQLFVPNPKHKKQQLKNRARPDRGENKPNDSVLWTSSAIKNNNKWSSEWVEWCESEMPQWLGKTGFLYQVSSDIVSLQLNNDKDVVNIWNIFCDEKDKLDFKVYRKDIQNYVKLVREFPWDKIAKHFDCVYCKEKPQLDNHFMYGWDCESTVFLNSNKVKLIKEIKL